MIKTVNDYGFTSYTHSEIVEIEKEVQDNIGRLSVMELKDIILPLLYNLKSNPEQDYIYWPNREDIINNQIGKVEKILKRFDKK